MSDQADEKVLVDELKKLNDKPGLEITLSAVDAWVLMANLQLACRHPGNQGAGRMVAQSIARGIQEALATTPELWALAESGWVGSVNQAKERRLQ